MVNVVVITQSIFQMDIIINGRNNVLFRNMLRYQIMNIPADSIFQFVNIAARLLKDPLKNRIIHLLCNPYFLRVNLYHSLQVYHHIGEHLNAALLLRPVNPHIRNSRVLDLVCHFPCYLFARLGNDFPCDRADHILGEYLSRDTILHGELLIKLISSYLRQVITSRIEKHTGDQALCAVHRKRFTRTDLLI